jgi:hypothetical protein
VVGHFAPRRPVLFAVGDNGQLDEGSTRAAATKIQSSRIGPSEGKGRSWRACGIVVMILAGPRSALRNTCTVRVWKSCDKSVDENKNDGDPEAVKFSTCNVQTLSQC